MLLNKQMGNLFSRHKSRHSKLEKVKRFLFGCKSDQTQTDRLIEEQEIDEHFIQIYDTYQDL